MEKEAYREFMEFEGRQVKIVKNLQVNVLETSETLLANKFGQTDVISEPSENAEDEILSEDKKFVIKPLRVDIKPLDEKCKVGVCYGSHLFHNIAVRLEEKTIQKINHEPVQLDDVKKLGEDELEIILDSDIEDTENEAVVNIDTSSDPEIIVEDTLEMQKDLENRSEKTAYFLDFEENLAKDCNINELKKLWKVSDAREKAQKKKILNLKTILANMEKKLSVQKRDIKIKELEETIKIKNIELVEKNAYISRLKEENDHLMKFKCGYKLVKNDLEILSRRSYYSNEKNSQTTEGNIIEKDIKESTSSDPTGKNAKSLSEFLSRIAEAKVVGDKNNSPRVSSKKSKNKADGDCVEIGNDIIDLDIRLSNEKGRYTTAAISISSDDLVSKYGENILFDGFGKLEHYPIFSEGASTIHEGAVDSFLRLKQFASRCSKSPNIVERESRKRKKLSTSTTISEGFPSKPKQKNFSCDKCLLFFMNQFELSLHTSTYHLGARKTLPL